ncbi:MAG: hypothetical protein MHM6MM_000927 [Cercozoa sp. M6MM]
MRKPRKSKARGCGDSTSVDKQWGGRYQRQHPIMAGGDFGSGMPSSNKFVNRYQWTQMNPHSTIRYTWRSPQVMLKTFGLVYFWFSLWHTISYVTDETLHQRHQFLRYDPFILLCKGVASIWNEEEPAMKARRTQYRYESELKARRVAYQLKKQGVEMTPEEINDFADRFEDPNAFYHQARRQQNELLRQEASLQAE